MTIITLGKIQAAIAGAVLALGIPMAEVSAARPLIANHRAIYDMTLSSATERSGITSIQGRMVLEFSGNPCDGFTLNSRIVTQFGNRDGKVTQSDIRSTQWESGDGTAFRFGTRQYLDNALQEETEGRATRGTDGDPGVGVLTKPTEESFELPADAVFPTEHNFRIMQAAFNGETTQKTIVFDATDGKKIYSATSFIGAARAPGAADLPEGIEDAGRLGKMRSWPVAISYFDETAGEAGDQLPSHEIAFTMFENGISTSLVLNYGDFSVEGELKGLEIFEAQDCD